MQASLNLPNAGRNRLYDRNAKVLFKRRHDTERGPAEAALSARSIGHDLDQSRRRSLCGRYVPHGLEPNCQRFYDATRV
jgi:hypothetical protein